MESCELSFFFARKTCVRTLSVRGEFEEQIKVEWAVKSGAYQPLGKNVTQLTYLYVSVSKGRILLLP